MYEGQANEFLGSSPESTNAPKPAKSSKSPVKNPKIAALLLAALAIIITILAIVAPNNIESPEEPQDPAGSSVIYIDETQYVDGAKDYSGYKASDLATIADTYSQLTEEERRSDKYINLGYQLKQNVTSYAEKYGYSDVGTILSVVSLAQYYLANGRVEEALSLTSLALDSTDNSVARYHYYYVLYRYYADKLDYDNAKKYGNIILEEIPENIVPLAMEEYKSIRQGIVLELQHLEEYQKNAKE